MGPSVLHMPNNLNPIQKERLNQNNLIIHTPDKQNKDYIKSKIPKELKLSEKLYLKFLTSQIPSKGSRVLQWISPTLAAQASQLMMGNINPNSPNSFKINNNKAAGSWIEQNLSMDEHCPSFDHHENENPSLNCHSDNN